IAGAFTSATVSLILLLLGSGLGLATASPWSHSGTTVATFTVATAIWLIIMQWISSGLGGYLTGRLRSKMMQMHTDEVFFRDTAHGFLAWALATIITAAFLSSAISFIISGGGNVTTAVLSSASRSADHDATLYFNDSTGDPTTYIIDSLFRSEHTMLAEGTLRGETTRILISGISNGNVADADKAYLAQLVSMHTGLSQADATKRVDDVISKLTTVKDRTMKEIETARINTMHISIYTFLSILIGAFTASTAAGLGGQHRDRY
ncbi:MAG: hypothetical protein KBA75_00500, partial [Alphaproteobacteria bacterium]|nr:hypothetical protein [Alphaproteobacteria bacterium]